MQNMSGSPRADRALGSNLQMQHQLRIVFLCNTNTFKLFRSVSTGNKSVRNNKCGFIYGLSFDVGIVAQETKLQFVKVDRWEMYNKR